MNQHRQLQKAKLVDAQKKRDELRVKGVGLCRMIGPLIDPNLNEIEEMEIAVAAASMDELVMLQGEVLTLSARISRLEEALYS